MTQKKPRPFALGLILTLVAAACSDMPTQSGTAASAPSFARAASGFACTTAGAAVATDEPSLRSALAAAQPGSVVAVDGTITIEGIDDLSVPAGVTLTCATAGSGLVHASEHYALLVIAAPNASVSGLVLDGSSSEWPVYAVNQAAFGEPDAHNVSITGNQIVCGWSGCVFVVGISSSVVSGNRIEARHPAGTGIHLQAWNVPAKYLLTDNARVENNTLTALVPVGAPPFGAIRPRDGSNVVVRGNRIVGPWSNGIAMAEIRNSVFERNVVEGATRSGLFFASNPFSAISVSGSLYRANEMTSLGGPTAFLQKACGNVLVGNRFSAPAGKPTVAFAASTGSNELLGSSANVEDNGDFDCDGDGVSDPNGITGKTYKGGHSGDVIAPAMQMGGRTVH